MQGKLPFAGAARRFAKRGFFLPQRLKRLPFIEHPLAQTFGGFAPVPSVEQRRQQRFGFRCWRGQQPLKLPLRQDSNLSELLIVQPDEGGGFFLHLFRRRVFQKLVPFPVRPAVKNMLFRSACLRAKAVQKAVSLPACFAFQKNLGRHVRRRVLAAHGFQWAARPAG